MTNRSHNNAVPRHPETGIYTRLAKDLAVRRTEDSHIIENGSHRSRVRYYIIRNNRPIGGLIERKNN